ncbi:MAG TPA: fumarate hydratase C-terminal domain-containing protein [Anaeromyxobacteraceae bacterium]|nr:fumarate hydratase C-terminal domain-containing protein [Anaeromyxobacteraceae bacterium]
MPRSLTLPLGEHEARALRAGDEVLLKGRLLTGLEAAHRHLLRHDEPEIRRLARGSVLYHCAPVPGRGPRGRWRVLAAGPTPSMRLEAWGADLLPRLGLRGVMGRGGMGPRTLSALRRHGAVYLHAGSDLAVALGRCVTSASVHLLDVLGPAEAIWCLEVEDFPAVVSMDAHGESLHAPAEAEHAEDGAAI